MTDIDKNYCVEGRTVEEVKINSTAICCDREGGGKERWRDSI